MATRNANIASIPRASTNGAGDKLQQALDTAQPQVGLHNILKGALELTTQTNAGNPAVIRVPHSVLAILVTVALACVGAGFWLVSSITEMRTNLASIQQSQRDIKAQQSSNLKLITAYATNETNRINFMTGLLTESQRQQVYKYDNANPRPSLPETNDSPDDPQKNH